jgi:hypothetical protein
MWFGWEDLRVLTRAELNDQDRCRHDHRRERDDGSANQRRHGSGYTTILESGQDQGVVQRALGGQEQRDEQDRTELADRPSREEVGAEAGAQLAAVGEDRDQRANRSRDQR